MQLRYLGRTEFFALGDPAERRDAFGRDLVVIASLQASTLNFSTQVARPDPNHLRRWICEVTGAEHYPAVYALRAKGFKNEMARRYGQPDLSAWERPGSDRVVWRMVRDIWIRSDQSVLADSCDPSSQGRQGGPASSSARTSRKHEMN